MTAKPRPTPAPLTLCRHYECVCARAAELAAIGLTHVAVELHIGRTPVRCRKVKP